MIDTLFVRDFEKQAGQEPKHSEPEPTTTKSFWKSIIKGIVVRLNLIRPGK